MSVMTLEGVVENGTIRLISPTVLPEKAKVYVVIPGMENKIAHVYSPRLVHPEQAKALTLEMVEEFEDDIL